MFMEYAKELLSLGEAIHGSTKEREVLEFIKSKRPGGKEIPVNTKEWRFKSRVVLNGVDVRATVMPYSKGVTKGRIGREIMLFRFPDHPFKVKDLYQVAKENGAEAVVFYESGKTRRIGVPGEIPAISLPFKPEGEMEIEVDSTLVDSTSYAYELTYGGGDEYVAVSAHYDHWLTGFHDNIASVALLLSLSPPKGKRGVKLIFFPSEEGPRCCTGSMSYRVEDVSSALVLDALYPDRVVFSSPPELWGLYTVLKTKVKRVEMPTPFSDGWSFLFKGVPSITLYNDDMINVYHSDADLPVQGDEDYFSSVKDDITSILRYLTDNDVKIQRPLAPDFVNLTSQFRY